MKMDPFIEAEEVAGRSVNACCDMFEVSRAAYYQRRRGVPSARDVSDTELTEQITAVHTESKGTYGSPRVHQEPCTSAVSSVANAGCAGSCARRPRGPLQEAVAQDHHP